MTIEDVAPPRGAEQRKRDALERLERDHDAWVATASPDGVPRMVPLCFVYHDGALVMCTRASNPTARNLRDGGPATVGVGLTRDVVLIEADAECVGSDELSSAEGDAFAAKLDWDPRGQRAWVFLRFRPRTLRAWREENEFKEGRELMRDGVWLV